MHVEEGDVFGGTVNFTARMVCGFSLDENGVPCFEKQYHASGHASGEDITWAIDQIDPDHIVPIHTEARDWFAKSFENVVPVEEGRSYEF
jgi:ribonuclease J